MDRLTAIRIFVEVVERGSLTAASERLDMSRAMVSRYLAEMETWMGARLLHRTTRRLSLTAAGTDALPRCRQMLELATDMQTLAASPQDVPRGTLRITCSLSLGQACLSRMLSEYVRQHPGTAVDVMVTERTINLIEERIDLAIRITNDLDPNLIARRLAVCRSVVCASPAYLREHGAPQRMEDLALHNCLTYTYFGKSLWEFTHAGAPVSVPVSGTISANEASLLLSATVNGAGISLQPMYSAAPLLRSGELVALLPEYEPRAMDIYGVYASRRQMPLIVRSVLDFLVDAFARELPDH